MAERITFLAPMFPRAPSGGARVYYEYANGLARRGYQVSILHSINSRPRFPGRQLDAARELLRDVRYRSLGRRVRWMAVDPRVEMLFRNDMYTQPPPKADVLVSTYWQTAEYLAGVPAEYGAKLQLVQAYEVWAGPADLVDATWRLPFPLAVVSEDLRRRGIQLGVPDHMIHVVPNGLDHALFRPHDALENRPSCIGMLVHEAPVKGLTDGLRALVQVHEKRPEIPILTFGTAPRPAVVPSWIDYVRRPVGERLVREVYGRFSVFLCPSLSEGWGFPSAEAMACGAALVSTRNGGVEDFAVDERSALLVPTGNSKDMAAAILGLLADERRRLEIARSGMASVAELNWERSTDSFESALQAALRHAGRSTV